MKLIYEIPTGYQCCFRNSCENSESKCSDLDCICSSRKLYISVLTIAEIRQGIERLEVGARKARLMVWLDNDVARLFAGRILPVTQDIATKWGFMTAKRPLPIIDTFIAATCFCHDLTLVARNVRDFSHFGFEIINPFEIACVQ